MLSIQHLQLGKTFLYTIAQRSTAGPKSTIVQIFIIIVYSFILKQRTKHKIRQLINLNVISLTILQ